MARNKNYLWSLPLIGAVISLIALLIPTAYNLIEFIIFSYNI